MGRESYVVRSPGFRPLPAALRPPYPQSHRAPDHRRIAHRDQRDVVLFGESRQADGDLAGQRGRAVEHHQVEGAAAEEDVGAPGAPGSGVGADDPEETTGSRVGPLARRERSRAIDERHPATGIDRAHDQLPDECGPAAAARALDFRQPAAGNASIRERAIQRLDPGGDRDGTADSGGCQDRRQLLAERGKGHERVAGRGSRAPGVEANGVPGA